MSSDFALKEEHRAFIRFGFDPSVDLGGFHIREVKILRRYGSWFRALSNGQLAPLTAQKERFVLVASGEADPISEFELVWSKYLRCEKVLREHEILNMEHRTQEALNLIHSGALPYETLRGILDRAGQFKFSDQDIATISDQLARKKPTSSLNHNSFIEYSSPNGRD